MAAPGIPPGGGDIGLTDRERIQREHRILVSQYGKPLVTRYIGAALEQRMNRLNARDAAFNEAYADAIAAGESEEVAERRGNKAADNDDVDEEGRPYPPPPPEPLTPAERERERLYNIMFFNAGPPISPVEMYRRRANQISAGMTDAQLTPWPTLESVHAHAASIGLMPIAGGGGRRRRRRSSSTSSSSSSSSSGSSHGRSHARRTKTTRSTRVRGRR